MDEDFDELMTRLRAGDAQAVDLVFHRFSARLIALARKHLAGRMRQKVDPEDVLQSVFQSFFRRQANGQLQVANWNSLWSLLTVITLHKCGHRVEYFHAACRDIRREMAQPSVIEDSLPLWETIARDPTPSDGVILAETVEQTLRAFDGRDRQIVELSLQGESVAEISLQIGCSERTVKRVLERVRRHLLKNAGSDG